MLSSAIWWNFDPLTGTTHAKITKNDIFKKILFLTLLKYENIPQTIYIFNFYLYLFRIFHWSFSRCLFWSIRYHLRKDGLKLRKNRLKLPEIPKNLPKFASNHSKSLKIAQNYLKLRNNCLKSPKMASNCLKSPKIA